MNGTHSRQAGRQGLIADGHQAEWMRRSNEAAVMRAVFGHGPLSRANIVRLTGLSAPSVTKLTGRLVEAGLVRELSPESRPELGRPRVPLEVDGDRVVLLGVHIGKASTSLALLKLDGSVVARRSFLHERTAPTVLADRIADEVNTLLDARLDSRRLLGTGVILGGWVDDVAGVVVEHEPLGWENVPLLDLLENRLPGPVRLEEHIRAIARAEMWFGVGRDFDDLVFVHVGNVCDAAIVVNRTIHRGPRGAAGSIDHLRVTDESETTCSCGRSGCLAAVATDTAVVRAALGEGLIQPGDGMRELSTLAANKNRAADSLLRKRAQHVGRAVATLVDVVNPARVVLGRWLAGAHDPEVYMNDLRTEAAAWVHRADRIAERIIMSRLGAEPFVVASAAPVLEDVLSDPVGFAAASVTAS